MNEFPEIDTFLDVDDVLARITAEQDAMLVAEERAAVFERKAG
ncbi:hypothetical protein [Amycolatopsis samaneae]|uniref:Uncharacterized protein n=1 Tax=Amycolatopsis samaneae TaxID=664691 RepID=A0ABW5GLA7_9PSEU